MNLHAALDAHRRTGPTRRRLVILLAVALVAAGLAVWRNHRGLPPPVPPDLARLEPQLRDYIQEKVTWVREEPADPMRHATLGMVYAANALWASALPAFENAARLDPAEPLAHLYVAISLQELGRPAEALQRFRHITARFPDFAPGHYRLGEALLRSGDAAEAEPSFERLTVLAPKEWRGYANLGDIHLRRGDFAGAVTLLEQALALDPAAKNAHYLLGLALRGLGRAEDAQRELSLGLNAEHYPMPDAWSATASQHMRLLPDLFEQARGYADAGEAPKAVRLLEPLAAYHPTNPAVLLNLAIAYDRAGQPYKGRPILQNIIQMDPARLPAYVALAACFQGLGDMQNALLTADKAIQIGPDHAESYLAKANALLALERDADALEALKSAARCDPRNPEIQIELGDVYLRNLNRPFDAAACYEQAVALDPALFTALIRVADVRIRLRQPGPARVALEAARKIAPREAVLVALEKRLTNLSITATNAP